jgi:glycosyltransferase involved in cell wall biosynthesis
MAAAQTFHRKVAYRSSGQPISILMPVCQEAEGIESVVAELAEVVFRYLPEGSEFLIEEGGSTDGTKEILRELEQRWPFLKVNYSDRKEGFAAAARKLYERAACPLIFFTDSDGQCVASEFWRLAGALDGNDMVLGRKRVRHDPLMRRITSRVFNFIARTLFGFKYRDINFGYRLCLRSVMANVLESVEVMPTMINAEIVIIAHANGLRLVEVDVHHRPRLFGMSQGFAGFIPTEALHAFVGLLKLKKKLANGHAVLASKAS